MSDNYEKICKDRFERLEDGWEEMREDVSAIREKVFNGFGKQIDLIAKLIYIILSGVVLAIAVPIVLKVIT